MGKFVAYYRVSTQKQGLHGLGMDGQKAAVQAFLRGGECVLVGEFAEVESGKRNDRPELDNAIALCKKTKARLVIARLDRLARNAAFLLGLRPALMTTKGKLIGISSKYAQRGYPRTSNTLQSEISRIGSEEG